MFAATDGVGYVEHDVAGLDGCLERELKSERERKTNQRLLPSKVEFRIRTSVTCILSVV